MDETAIYFIDCIDFEGHEHIIMKSTGFSLMYNVACMCVQANDCKATLLIIHKGKDSDCITRKTRHFLTNMEAKVWVDSNALIKWINIILLVVAIGPGKLIAWDSCRTYISKSVEEHCQNRYIKTIIVLMAVQHTFMLGILEYFVN